MIARVTGQPLQQIYRERIFQPLGLGIAPMTPCRAGCWARPPSPGCGPGTSGRVVGTRRLVAEGLWAWRGGSGYKTAVWVSGDGRRVAVLLLDGRMADQATGELRATQALNQLYWRRVTITADPAVPSRRGARC